MSRSELTRPAWAKTPRDPDRRRAIGVALVASILGLITGLALDLVARSGLQVAGGVLMIVVAFLTLGSTAMIVERLRPRSGAPLAILVIATVVAAGPIGLYYVLPAVLLVTPVALYRAVTQKYR